MFPLPQSLSYPLAIFVEDDTIRPEVFIDRITLHAHDPASRLICLLNHIRTLRDPDLRHFELQDALDTELTKKYCVWTLARPVVLFEECHVGTLTDDALVRIALRLDCEALGAFSQACTRFRKVGQKVLTSSAHYIKKYVEASLSRPDPCLMTFEKQSYNNPYELQLTTVQSTQAFSQFPGASKIVVEFGSTTKETLTELLRQACGLRELSIYDSIVLDNAAISQMPSPALLTSCTLGGASDETARALAARCYNLQRLNLHCCKRLTVGAFSGKTPFMQLRELVLLSAPYQDDEVRHALLCCPSVRKLSLNSCAGFTGRGFAELAHVPFLEELDVRITPLESEHFCTILSRAKRLRVLDVSFCDGLSAETFEEAEYPPVLKKVVACWTNIAENGVLKIKRVSDLEREMLTP